ncbi:hypothetical protein Y032_0094g2779 [Ancylostoma ceylanicum]|uniref:Uncharacterized protein n=1 Tax=Ancylostoma ceylanicum TaxID=53326 RepID=A0A016TLB4_9BILA|nr:hypothetical protein Y032_0094g2779 [Ancylostoma ceylanicum]
MMFTFNSLGGYTPLERAGVVVDVDHFLLLTHIESRTATLATASLSIGAYYAVYICFSACLASTNRRRLNKSTRDNAQGKRTLTKVLGRLFSVSEGVLSRKLRRDFYGRNVIKNTDWQLMQENARALKKSCIINWCHDEKSQCDIVS